MLDIEDRAQLRWIEAEDIADVFHPQPFPPRAARGRLAPLVQSLRIFGCICPIVARPLQGRLQVVCGYRRLLATQAAGRSPLPVLVRELTDDDCRRLFAQENSHREPLVTVRSRAPYQALWEGAGETAEEPNDQAAKLRKIIPRQLEPEPEMPQVSEVRPARPPALREARALEATGVPNGLQGPAAPAGPPPPIAPAADLPSPDVLSVPEPSFDQQMGTLAARAAACFRSIAASRSIPVQEAEAIATELIALAPLEHGRDLRGFYTESPDWLASHSMIVAGLGVHLARALEWTPGQVKKFALACLLHDVGMLFIPRHFLIAPGKLNPAQRAQVQRHPQIGREVIQGSRAFGAQIHLVAQDHHERWDGSGYPSGKKGKEVDLPARIVGFLDCFAALISSRPHRPALLYTQALRFMSHATVLGLHDPTILMHFRNIFTDLPVGSWLRLVDGRIGRVVGADPGNPRRHCIRILEERPGLRDETPVWMETEEPSATEIPPPAARHALSAGDPSPAEHRVQVSGSQATNSLS